MSVVGRSAAAKQLARLVAMVVLPAPPFGLSTRVVFISARGSASPCSCVERDLHGDDAARFDELQEKRERIRLRLEAAAFEYHCASTNRVAEHAKMKRKYGSALARESEAEKAQRLRAKEMRDNQHNYGSASRKGAISRGKKRGKAYRAGG